jgi:hypothetical protein
MTDLTEEQCRELGRTEPRLRDPRSEETYVLVRSDVYVRMKALLEDGAILATGELIDRVMAEDDANDPHLAEYQRLDDGGGR